MTISLAPTAGNWRIVHWTAVACIAGAWIAEIVAASLGTVAWPNWLNLVAVTGLLASNLIRPVRLRVTLAVAMAILSVARGYRHSCCAPMRTTWLLA
jgi:hypothetical protein